jgi:hypothetical protein
MTAPLMVAPRQRALRGLDVLVVCWVVCWVAVAWLSGTEIRNLARLAETMDDTGGAIQQAGRALQLLDAIPLVGDAPAELGERVRAAGEQVRRDGRATRSSIHRLSVLLGVSIFVLPVAPVLVGYLPARLARGRERRRIRAALRGAGSVAGRDALVDEFLARRALAHLPFQALRSISDAPWRDVEAGRHRQLADAELRHLGLRRPPAARGAERGDAGRTVSAGER